MAYATLQEVTSLLDKHRSALISRAYAAGKKGPSGVDSSLGLGKVERSNLCAYLSQGGFTRQSLDLAIQFAKVPHVQQGVVAYDEDGEEVRQHRGVVWRYSDDAATRSWLSFIAEEVAYTATDRTLVLYAISTLADLDAGRAGEVYRERGTMLRAPEGSSEAEGVTPRYPLEESILKGLEARIFQS